MPWTNVRSYNRRGRTGRGFVFVRGHNRHIGGHGRSYLANLRNAGLYKGRPRPAFNMDVVTDREIKERKESGIVVNDYSYDPINKNTVQRHWDFNREYATYKPESMKFIYHEAKKLSPSVKNPPNLKSIQYV